MQKASTNSTGFVCLFQFAAQNSAVSSFIEVFSLKCVVSCRSHVRIFTDCSLMKAVDLLLLSPLHI